MEKQKSGLRRRIEAAEAERRLERDIAITRQRTGNHEIKDRDDLLAVLGQPVSAGAPMKTAELTAEQREHQAEANREKRAPSYNELWQEYWPIFQYGPKGKKGKVFLRGAELAWENHVARTDVGRLPCNHVTSDMAELYIKKLSVGYDMKSKLLQRFQEALRASDQRRAHSLLPLRRDQAVQEAHDEGQDQVLAPGDGVPPDPETRPRRNRPRVFRLLHGHRSSTERGAGFPLARR